MNTPTQTVAEYRRQTGHPLATSPAGAAVHSRLGALVGVSINLVVLVVGAFFLMKEVSELSKLRAGSETTQAVVTDLHVDSGEDSDTCYVQYRYRAPRPEGGRQEFEDRHSIDCADYDLLVMGQTIPVVYAVSDPAISRLQSEYPPTWSDYLFWGVAGVIGLGGLGGSGFIVFWFWRRRRVAWNLEVNGQLTQGRVARLWPPDEDSTTGQVAYEFWGGHGAVQAVPAAVCKNLAEGQSVSVRYLPDRPNISRMELN